MNTDTLIAHSWTLAGCGTWTQVCRACSRNAHPLASRCAVSSQATRTVEFSFGLHDHARASPMCEAQRVCGARALLGWGSRANAVPINSIAEARRFFNSSTVVIFTTCYSTAKLRVAGRFRRPAGLCVQEQTGRDIALVRYEMKRPLVCAGALGRGGQLT